jgi:uncharacterized membrane protein YgcG
MKTSPITFCGSSVEHIIDHPTKTLIVDAIRQLTDLAPDSRTTRIMRSPHDASFLRNPHLMALATRGQRFWMYLTQVNHQNVCLLVERSIKPGYPFPKMLAVQYQFNDTLYQNTLLEVEVLNDAGGCDAPLILWTDLLVLKNRDVRNWDPIRRFNVMHTILEKQYHENMVLQPCALQIKRLFASTDWNAMLAFVKALPYVPRGLMFYPLNTRYPARLWLDDHQELVHAEAVTEDAMQAGGMQMNPEASSYPMHRSGKGRYGKGGGGKGGGKGKGKGRHGKGNGKGKGRYASGGGGMMGMGYGHYGASSQPPPAPPTDHPLFNGPPASAAPPMNPYEGMGSLAPAHGGGGGGMYFPPPAESVEAADAAATHPTTPQQPPLPPHTEPAPPGTTAHSTASTGADTASPAAGVPAAPAPAAARVVVL